MKLAFFCPLVFLAALTLRAAEPATPPAAATDTASHTVLQPGQKLGEKATTHRFEKLRAGAIRTAEGWNVQDFASCFFNPPPEEITVTMKMVSDDPKFLCANGQIGTYTKTVKLRPMQGETDNIYIGSPTFGKPEWPVAPLTNFTGSVEFSSSKPFYYYFLRETEVGEAPDATVAYFISHRWKIWQIRQKWIFPTCGLPSDGGLGNPVELCRLLTDGAACLHAGDSLVVGTETLVN